MLLTYAARPDSTATFHNTNIPFFVLVPGSVPLCSRPPVTSHLMFSNRAISITVPRLWNDLPPELRTISLPPPPLLPITKHHLHPASSSITPGLSTQN